MESCFRTRIGLDPNSRVQVNISSFDGVLVAKGYNRILTTWQGFFVEMDRNDVVFAHLTPNEYPEDGDESWLSPGLKVFSLTTPDNRRKPRAHRFAINPTFDLTGPCNHLSTDKWYLHAYQVKFLVGNTSKSLNSSIIATTLRDRYPDTWQTRGKILN